MPIFYQNISINLRVAKVWSRHPNSQNIKWTKTLYIRLETFQPTTKYDMRRKNNEKRVNLHKSSRDFDIVNMLRGILDIENINIGKHKHSSRGVWRRINKGVSWWFTCRWNDRFHKIKIRSSVKQYLQMHTDFTDMINQNSVWVL